MSDSLYSSRLPARLPKPSFSVSAFMEISTFAEGFLGAYGVFFAVALYSIFRKGLKSWVAIIMLLVVVYLYVASATQWAMNAWVTFTKIHGFLMVADVPFQARPRLAEAAILKVVGIQEAIFDFNMTVGDSVVVWRTWAVYQHRAQRRILVILVPDTACSNYDGAAPLPGICYQAGLIGWGLSAATNIACTIFIGLKARRHRKITRPLGKPNRMSAERVLSILFDSGFIYSLLWVRNSATLLTIIDQELIFQLSQIISVFATAHIITLRSPAVYLWGVIAAMGNQMAGFYPTLVIVIVNLRCTVWEDEEESIPVGSSSRWTVNTKGSGKTDAFGSQRGEDIVNVERVFDITSDKAFVHASKYPRV
ncbi:hypothetical protein B0H19DRAFT_1079570 [Mycena capillaripes]|nr:hypothetical protein B0H19DRAFT_1079570 [Mycena capillaripes]